MNRSKTSLVPSKLVSFFRNYSIEDKCQENQSTTIKDKKNGATILMKQITIYQNQLFKSTIEALKQQVTLQNDHLLTLIDFDAKQDKEGQLEILLFYDHCKITLANQLAVRISQNRCFKQEELWNMMLSVVCGAAYLQENQIGHGCISPHDIFISPDGVVKLADPTLASSSPFIMKEGYYYSIELLGYFQEDQLLADFNIFKSDVFSLGVCMIESAILESCVQCYEYDQICLIQQPLDRKISLLENYYSQEFVGIIKWMLQFQAFKRPDFIQLRQAIISTLAERMFQQQMTSIHQQKSAQREISFIQKESSRSMIKQIFSNQNSQEFLFQSESDKQYHGIPQNAFFDHNKQFKTHQRIKTYDEYFREERPKNYLVSEMPNRQTSKGHARTSSFNAPRYQKQNVVQKAPQHGLRQRKQQYNYCQIKDFRDSFKRQINKDKPIQNLKTSVDESNAGSNLFEMKSQDCSNSRSFNWVNSRINDTIYAKQNKDATVYTDPDFLASMKLDAQNIIERRMKEQGKFQRNSLSFKRIL